MPTTKKRINVTIGPALEARLQEYKEKFHYTEKVSESWLIAHLCDIALDYLEIKKYCEIELDEETTAELMELLGTDDVKELEKTASAAIEAGLQEWHRLENPAR